MGAGYRPEEAKITEELCNGVQRVAQPVPFLLKSPSGLSVSDGGNCYACALQCVLNHFGVAPGTDREAVFQAIERFKSKYYQSETEHISQSCHGMEIALNAVPELEFETNAVPTFKFDKIYGAANGLSYNRGFLDNLEEKIKSGHLIISCVFHNRDRQERLMPEKDHWVVIDGVRTVRTPFYREDWTSCSARIDRQFRFVDSSTASAGIYWVEEFDLIRFFGCANSYFVRKRS